MSTTKPKHRPPKFRVKIEFSDSEEESLEAFMRAMKIVLGDNPSPLPEKVKRPKQLLAEKS